MNKKKLSFILYVLMVVFVSSCISTKKTTYFNSLKDGSIIANIADTVYPLIQKNDILSVTITSLNAEASSIFNLPNTFSTT